MDREGRLLVSACLVGVRCRHDGRAAGSVRVRELLAGRGGLVVCPEQLGGLATPRTPAEIVEGEGLDVLEGRCRVCAVDGTDVTEEFLRGASEVLRLARLMGIRDAILKEGSPSCGVRLIHNRGRRKRGAGVLAALLRIHGVRVKSAG